MTLLCELSGVKQSHSPGIILHPNGGWVIGRAPWCYYLPQTWPPFWISSSDLCMAWGYFEDRRRAIMNFWWCLLDSPMFPTTFKDWWTRCFVTIYINFCFLFIVYLWFTCYSTSLEYHTQYLWVVLSLLQTHQLFANREEMPFGQPKLKYLGNVISTYELKSMAIRLKLCRIGPPQDP